MRFLQKLRSLRKNEDRIVLLDDAFVISTARGSNTVAFAWIMRIDAYKRDEFTTNLICCDIEIVSQEGDHLVWFVHEDLPGFNDLMRRFESLPGFDADWYPKVVQPPFVENRTTVFSRPSNPA